MPSRYRMRLPGPDAVLMHQIQTFDPRDWEHNHRLMTLFREEFIASDRYSAGRGRGRRPGAATGPPRAATGPNSKGRIKKMVRERGFGFIRGDDGKEVFFHRSGLNGSDYDLLSEGDTVEYVVSEGARGARAENVRSVSEKG